MHGLVGLRFDYDVHAGTVQRLLHVDPAVPATFASGMYLSGLRYMNLLLAVNLTSAGLQVTNLGPIAGAVAANTTLHVKTGEILGVQSFYIAAGETHTLPVCVVPPQSQDSLCECGRARFANMTAGVAGDMIELISDGDNSTAWQAVAADGAKILVDLLRNTTVRECTTNWAKLPPAYVRVHATIPEFNAVRHFYLLGAVLAGVSFLG